MVSELGHQLVMGGCGQNSGEGVRKQESDRNDGQQLWNPCCGATFLVPYSITAPPIQPGLSRPSGGIDATQYCAIHL